MTSVDAAVESGRWSKRAPAVKTIDTGRAGAMFAMFVFVYSNWGSTAQSRNWNNLLGASCTARGKVRGKL